MLEREDNHVQIGVLLPARLETRFVEEISTDEAGQETRSWKLRIAVIPDDPWMDRHSKVVSKDEAASLERMWAACNNDPEVLRTADPGRTAFRKLAAQVGAARAWWLVNEAGPEIGGKAFSRMDSLPETIEIWLGMRQGEQVELQRLDPPMQVNRDALVFDGQDGAGLNLFMQDRWWTKDAGLQAEYPLPFTDKSELLGIEVILAVGLGEASPGALFQNHRSAGSLSLLPLGMPTNTIAGEPAADLAQDPDLWWALLSGPPEPETSEDISLMLAGDRDSLRDLPGGTRRHRRLNEGLTSLLWPALWAHTLKDIWGVDRALGWLNFSHELGGWAQAHLHPEGPLAPIRIGEQPYGLWPVTRLNGAAWNPAADVEAGWLLSWLPRSRERWDTLVRQNSGTVAGERDPDGELVGADTDRFVRLLGRTPSASAYGYRSFLPLQVMYKLARSFLASEPAGTVAGHQDWFRRVVQKTEEAAGELGFPVRPIRRYMTSGWRQDLALPLVEPPRSTSLIGTPGGGMLFYNHVTGEGIPGRIVPGSDFQAGQPIRGFSAWTHIIPVRDELLFFYNRTNGSGFASWLDAEGNYTAISSIPRIRSGWTHLVGVPAGGLLFYSSLTGTGQTASFDEHGNFNSGSALSGFSREWTHIVAANTATLLFYNAATGSSWCSRLFGDGTYASIGEIGGIAPGWTHVTGTTRGDLFFYNAENGEAATARLTNAGEFRMLNSSFLTLAGWTHITCTESGDLLFFNFMTGKCAAGRLDGGDFDFSDRIVDFVSDHTSLFFNQIERIFAEDSAGNLAGIFAREDCDFVVKADSLLLHLILHSMARLHAEFGRMHETMDFDGLPFIESFDPGGNCSDLQAWTRAASELTSDLLFDDGFLHDFFQQVAPPDEIARWPIVRQYRSLFETLRSWRDDFNRAVVQEERGAPGAVLQLLADIERAFRAALDTAAVRIDPWATGMAWGRLKSLREKGGQDGLGLYAWVDQPFTGTPGPTEGGTLLAPSHAQLLTSVILRDKQITDPQAGRWQIELDSHKVRLARQFAGEVRAGAHIQEVLGRTVEGIVGNKQQIEQLRGRFMIRKEHAGRRVCDGQQALAPGEARDFLDGLNLQQEQLDALEDLREVIDTYGDLLVADSVHAVVSGRPEKAGEIMDAAAGLELPPDFGVLRTPQSGNSVVTTVWLALEAAQQPDGTDPDASPAQLADASAAAFLERSVPAGDWTWRVDTKDMGTQIVSLADLGLSVPETLAYSEDALSQLAIRQVDGIALAQDGEGSEALPASRRLRRLAALFSGTIRDVQNDESMATAWKTHDEELVDRLNALRTAASDLAAALDPALGDPAALARARRWGIAPAPLEDAEAPEEYRFTAEQQLERQLSLARAALEDRLARVDATGANSPAHQVARALGELSGNSLPIFGRIKKPALESAGLLIEHPTLDRDWLETVAAVRPNLARLEAHQLDAEEPLQAWCTHEDPWTFREDGDGRIKRPMSVAVCYSPEQTLDAVLAVSVLDSWSEMVLSEPHVVEAAFGFNAPSSRAPQAILLAVPPDEDKPLDAETLAHIVLEARETAHARMVTPDDLDRFAALFPLAMVPAQPPTGVPVQPHRPD